MIKGRCMCGRVTYTYHGEINEIAMCHCSTCRHAQGGAFATNSPLDSDKLEFEGKEHIKEFLSSADKVRAFCQNCGSPLYSAKPSIPSVKRVRLGTVETEFTCENKYHIHSNSSAPWHQITDEYHQFADVKTD